MLPVAEALSVATRVVPPAEPGCPVVTTWRKVEWKMLMNVRLRISCEKGVMVALALVPICGVCGTFQFSSNLILIPSSIAIDSLGILRGYIKRKNGVEMMV